MNLSESYKKRLCELSGVHPYYISKPKFSETGYHGGPMWVIENNFKPDGYVVYKEKWLAELYYVYFKDVKSLEEFEKLTVAFENAIKRNSKFDPTNPTHTINKEAMEDFVFAV